jgi:hypothetical protein
MTAAAGRLGRGNPGDERCHRVFGFYGMYATASISTLSPGLGSATT